jgi:hypothetical protein
MFRINKNFQPNTITIHQHDCVIASVNPLILLESKFCIKYNARLTGGNDRYMMNEKLNPPAMLGRLEEDVSGMRK